MAAFLSVLSVIGHILLIVLVVLAAVLLVILFVPVRYRLNGRITDPENRDEPLNMEMLLQRTTADFSFSWLIHLVRGGISYPQKPNAKTEFYGKDSLVHRIWCTKPRRKENGRGENWKRGQ